MNKRKIIIDCDPGHDDATAMLVAFAHESELELLGIVTVCGNNTAENGTENARIVCTAAGKDVPVAMGAVRPLINMPLISDEFHGKTGMDGHHITADSRIAVMPENGVVFMHKLLADSSTPVTLVALGPLTNIALLLRTYPEISKKIELISLMGGGIAHGNVTDDAEFNIYVDPEAAEIVFSSGIPIVMSGLDVTEQVTIQQAEYEPLRGKSIAATFFCELMDFYVRGAAHFGATGCVMHDPCAMCWLLDPEAFGGVRGCVSVVLNGEARGKTVLEADAGGNTLVLNKADAKRVVKLILNSVAAY